MMLRLHNPSTVMASGFQGRRFREFDWLTVGDGGLEMMNRCSLNE